MHKLILATLENYDGLPADMVERLKGLAYTSDHIFEVKKIEIANETYKVCIEVDVRGEKVSFIVDSKNVNLYERYEEDYKVYNPFDDPEVNNQKEKGEN